MLTSLGLLTLTRRRLLLQILAGLAGGLAAFLLATLLINVGTWTTPPTDPRQAITTNATTAAAALHGLINAAPSEELIYRGPLLFALAGMHHTTRTWRPTVRRTALRRTATVAALVITSCLYGALHTHYGALNVTTATANGLIWGTLAIRARSILPALTGHGTYNALAFAIQTL